MTLSHIPHDKHLIAPSLLSADFCRLGEEVHRLKASGADWLHFDVMDGRFVPNISVGIPVLASLRRTTDMPIDVHLMIVEPDSLLGAFAKAGADTLTVQAEACVHLHRTLQTIRQLGCRAGVSLNPHTPVSCLEYVRELIDKIRTLRTLYPDLPIEVDGGIHANTIGRAAHAGANIFVSGSGIFSHADYAAAIMELRACASG